MKILVTGAGGMLGSDLVKALSPRFEVIGAGRSEAPHLSISYRRTDLTHPSSISEICAAEKPQLIFHAAAMTQVDRCEQDREEALRNNIEATKNIVAAANASHAVLIFFSTDYVFDGMKKGEYREEDPPWPLNVYGESKLLAEKHIQQNAAQFALFRVSWLYGIHGKSFPRTLLERAGTETQFKIVGDQIGRPTYTADLAAFFSSVLSKDEKAFERSANQVFHLANDGIASWAEFGSFILTHQYGNRVKVDFVSSREVNRPAQRPGNSVLSLDKAAKTFGIRLRAWQEAVEDFLHEYQPDGPSKP